MQYPKLLDVVYLSGHDLLLRFDNGEDRICDMSEFFVPKHSKQYYPISEFKKFTFSPFYIAWGGEYGYTIGTDSLYPTSFPYSQIVSSGHEFLNTTSCSQKITHISSADVRRDILREIKAHNHVRLEHLLKLFYYRQDTRDKLGWVRSVATSPFAIARQRGSNKYPKAKDIYHESWLVMHDSFQSMERGIFSLFINDITDYQAPSSPSLNSYQFCDEYHKWMSEQLSSEGAMIFSEVLSEIDRLLDKYKV